MNIPESFLWGAAASAPQTEGASHLRAKTTWDHWYELEPQAFHHQIGPQDTSNVYYDYLEDVGRMKEMNLNSYRTSISWARLLPDGKTLNQEAIDFYRHYFKAMLDHGIRPIINLFHFDMPMWMMDLGGWENPDIIDHFAYYAKTAFESFGDLVKDWTTFNEPMVHIECGYLGDAHWPRVRDFKRAVQVGYHTLLAHFAAVRAYRQLQHDGRIGTILNLSPVYPKSQDKEDLHARDMADLFYIRSLLDPICLGHFPVELVDLLRQEDLLPQGHPQEQDLLTYGIDFLGVNYYQPLRVQAPQKSRTHCNHPNYWFDGYDWPDKKINPHRGWEIYEKGIYDIAIRMRDDYGNMPWFISENGMGVEGEEQFIGPDGIVQDTYRIDFIRDHLKWLFKAIEEGSNCFGYHLWTFVDCWSWLNAYKNRYGFYRVDLDNNFERSRKLSSYWLADVIRNGSLDV